MRQVESKEAIGAVDEILAAVGLSHGRRQTLGGTWIAGERQRRSGRTGQVLPGQKAASAVKQPGVVRAGAWERYEWLNHGFSTRLGGVSEVYGAGELNLGWTASDDRALVAENRRRLVKEIAGARSSARLVTMRQVHSGVVRIVEKKDGGLDGKLETADGKAVMRGDGMMTDVPGVLLGVQVADCVPVLVADTQAQGSGGVPCGMARDAGGGS